MLLKSFVPTTVSALLVVISHSAFADVPTPPRAPIIEAAKLPEGEIDAAILGTHGFAGGEVFVTYGADRTPALVQLRIRRSKNCPNGAFCSMEIPAPFIVALPVTDVTYGPCGDAIITATEDRRPVDGALEEIVVQDMRNSRCDPARFTTEVSYVSVTNDRSTGLETVTRSALRGAPLTSLPSFH